jgi:ribosomal protein L11 methyltransferase
MIAVSITCRHSEKDLLSSLLWDLGTSGVIEHDLPDGITKLEAFFEDEPDIAALTAYAPRVETAVEADWEREYRDIWQPFEVGEKLFLAPPWSDEPTPQGRLRLNLRPGTACGTGLHPATQLCLAALEHLVRSGDVVLDVGAGSGILLEAALLLGASRVVGCDIDADAVAVARTNVRDALVFAGSVRACAPACADVVLVNISGATAVALASEIVRVFRHSLVLAGFRDNEIDRVTQAYTRHSLHVQSTFKRDGWVALVISSNTR